MNDQSPLNKYYLNNYNPIVIYYALPYAFFGSGYKLSHEQIKSLADLMNTNAEDLEKALNNKLDVKALFGDYTELIERGFEEKRNYLVFNNLILIHLAYTSFQKFYKLIDSSIL